MGGGVGGSKYFEMHRRSEQVGDADGMVERLKPGDVSGKGEVVVDNGVE